ncbi:MAG: DUF4832 domain-containing protein [Ruminococcus flavefaciens]|nr:DUF4832 domain-containing protein [Ruminococcus flavefaciens]
MKKFLSLMTVPVLLAGMTSIPAKADTSETQKRTISYTEKVGTIENPAMGYTSTVWANCKPNSTPTYNPTGSLVLFFIDIGAFSSGANGTTADDGTYTDGVDYDLDETFFTSWRTTFENCRKNGCTIALRFRYDANGKDKPEPATFDKVLDHIRQIKNSGILEEYKDIIAYVESGFVGKWGEQHGGKYTSVEEKAELLDAMLDCVPSPIPVTVRTPDIFAKWVGIERKDLADYEATGEELRVGLYNDGYMGSDSDLGTFANRQIETDWLSKQTITSYYGGEFSGNLDWAKKYDTYLPENAIPEMYKTHLSYINGNIFQLYKDYTYGEQYDMGEIDNSAYYGQNVFQFIRDHLGYRFVLRHSGFGDSENIKQGDTVEVHFSVDNTGFANPIPETKAEIILEQNGSFIRTPIDVNPNEWYSCTSNGEIVSLKLPDSIPTGDWNAYLKISMGDNTVDQLNLRSVQFANEDIWDASLGANYIGSFTVEENDTKGSDNAFYQTGTQPDENSGRMYTINGHTTADGLITSPYEWTDDMLIAENGGNKIYLNADDKYLYIMADFQHNAEKPVWNIRVENADNGESYWYYRQSAGWIYYNHGDYKDITLKVNGNIAEWKIAFGDVMGVQAGTNLKSVRIFVQDEADGWSNCGEAKSGEYTVLSKFPVYSAPYEIRLTEGETYTAKPEVFADNASYQWYLDRKAIDGATSPEYEVSEKGSYFVTVTANDVTAVIPVLTVAEVLGSALKGDINSDGKVNVADMVLLEKYILGSGSLTEKQYSIADLTGDNSVDSFDMVLMRQAII